LRFKAWFTQHLALILERHGLEPAPERSRKTTWKEFLTQHWEQIVAADYAEARPTFSVAVTLAAWKSSYRRAANPAPQAGR